MHSILDILAELAEYVWCALAELAEYAWPVIAPILATLAVVAGATAYVSAVTPY
jgi:hypothetical protein